MQQPHRHHQLEQGPGTFQQGPRSLFDSAAGEEWQPDSNAYHQEWGVHTALPASGPGSMSRRPKPALVAPGPCATAPPGVPAGVHTDTSFAPPNQQAMPQWSCASPPSWNASDEEATKRGVHFAARPLAASNASHVVQAPSVAQPKHPQFADVPESSQASSWLTVTSDNDNSDDDDGGKAKGPPADAPVRTGKEESLSEFLATEVFLEHSHGAKREQKRRLTAADGHFKAMHLLRFPRLRDSIICMTGALVSLLLGTVSKKSVWYKTVPTVVPMAGNNQSDFRYRYPISPTWMGPRHIHYNGVIEHLDEWQDKSCRTGGAMLSWAMSTAVRTPVLERLVKRAGCIDSNEISCRRHFSQNLCDAPQRRGGGTDRFELWEEVVNSCSWTCGRCRDNDDLVRAGALTQTQMLELWCEYRTEVNRSLFLWHWGIVGVCLIIAISTAVLALCKFNRLVVAMCTIVQMALAVILGIGLYQLWDRGNPAPNQTLEKFVSGLNHSVTQPVFSGLHEVTLASVSQGTRPSGGFALLWAGEVFLLMGSLSTLAWWGQTFQLCPGLGAVLSVPRLLFCLGGALLFLIVLLPIRIIWICLGHILKLPPCNSTFDPKRYGQAPDFWPHRFLGQKWQACFCLPLNPLVGSFLAEATGFLKHFLRTVDWDGFLYNARVVSEREVKVLEEHGVRARPAQNYIAWRRSVLTVVITFGCLNLPTKPLTAFATLRNLRESEVLSTPNTLEEFILHRQIVELVSGNGGVADRAASTHSARRMPYAPSPRRSLDNSLVVARRLQEEGGPAVATMSLAFERASLELSQQVAPSHDRNFTLFSQYMATMGIRALSLLQGGIAEVSVYEAVLAAVGEWSAIGMLMLASSAWVYLPTSRTWVLSAWLLQIFMPFTISLLPVSLFLDQAALDELIARVLQESVNFLSLDDTIRDCWTQVNRTVGQITSWRTRLNRLCGIVDSINRWGMSSTITQLRGQCVIFRTAEDTISWEDTERSLKMFCSGLQSFVFEGEHTSTPAMGGGSGAHEDEGPDELLSNSQHEALALVNAIKREIANAITILISMQFALSKLFRLLPAVLTICPALMMAAFRFRLLMPLATVPRLFLMMLPLIYCPLLWTQYVAVWQIAPDRFLMAALFIQCFGMLVWAVNVQIFRMYEPMSRAHLNRSLKKMGAMGMMNTVSMITCVVLFAFRFLLGEGQDGVWATVQDLAWAQVERLRDEPPIRTVVSTVLRVIVGFIFKLWLGKIAAYDFIMTQIIAQHEFDQCVEQMRPHQGDRSLDTETREYIDNIIKLKDESVKTMDALVQLASSSDVKTVGSGVVRKRM